MKARELVLCALALGASVAPATAQVVGRVLTQSNAAGGNEILVFERGTGGALTPAGSFPTGGLGNGGGLGSQGAVTFSHDGRWVLAVNAGSGSVSVFESLSGGLVLRDVEPTLGSGPTSVDVEQGLVYVLNATAPSSVAGFWLSDDGQLTPIQGAVHPLSAGDPAPAQVAITPGGAQVIVSERATNLIDLFPVLGNGSLGVPTFATSVGATPFGFELGKQNTLIVSEAFGGVPDASAVSSYKLSRAGSLTVVSPSVPTTETAACWIALTRDGRFAYTTNTGSGTVSGYRVDLPSGAIEALDEDGVTGDLGPGANPLDAAISRDGRFLFVLSPATGEIAVFLVQANGSLAKLSSSLGLPSSAAGLAAR